MLRQYQSSSFKGTNCHYNVIAVQLSTVLNVAHHGLFLKELACESVIDSDPWTLGFYHSCFFSFFHFPEKRN